MVVQGVVGCRTSIPYIRVIGEHLGENVTDLKAFERECLISICFGGEYDYLLVISEVSLINVMNKTHLVLLAIHISDY